MKKGKKIKTKIGFTKGHKGQAMMEYLMTYGLALVAILLVLAILFTVVLPSLKPPETCQFVQTGFGCSSKPHAIVANTTNSNVVTLFVQLDNQQGRSVHIKRYICTNAPPGNLNLETLRNPAADDLTVAYPPDGRALASGQSFTFTIPCRNLDANSYPVLAMTPGATFKGSVGILYNFDDAIAGTPDKIAVATVGGLVQ